MYFFSYQIISQSLPVRSPKLFQAKAIIVTITAVRDITDIQNIIEIRSITLVMDITDITVIKSVKHITGGKQIKDIMIMASENSENHADLFAVKDNIISKT
jgi:hypothetical protein